MNLYRLELKRVCKTRMTAILLAIALVLAAVSYTHLDVYKRQGRCRPRWEGL